MALKVSEWERCPSAATELLWPALRSLRATPSVSGAANCSEWLLDRGVCRSGAGSAGGAKPPASGVAGGDAWSPPSGEAVLRDGAGVWASTGPASSVAGGAGRAKTVCAHCIVAVLASTVEQGLSGRWACVCGRREYTTWDPCGDGSVGEGAG